MFDNLKEWLIESLGYLIWGDYYGDSGDRIRLRLDKWKSDTQTEFWEKIVEITPEIGDPHKGFWENILDSLTEFMAVLTYIPANAAPEIEKIRQDAWVKKPYNLHNPSDISGLWQNNLILLSDLTNWMSRSGLSDDPQGALAALYALNLDFPTWVSAYRKLNAQSPSDAEIAARWNIGIDGPDYHMAATEPLPPVEYIANYLLHYMPDSLVESWPASFMDIGPLEWGPGATDHLTPILGAYGLNPDYANMWLDTITRWAEPGAIVRAGAFYELGETWTARNLLQSGIHPNHLWIYSEAARGVPSALDLCSVLRRWDVHENDISNELLRMAVHPYYVPHVQEITRYYPNVPDLIHMAVREVFTPEVASKFGQFEDYPPEFELAANRAGLSTEWAQKYWAAHWDLPSITQGFEMYHRAIISYADLEMLLRAKDVMPYWRERMIELSHMVPGRIDARKMYYLGIYNPGELFENYLRLGYSYDDAENLTYYTMADTVASQTGFRPSSIFKSYGKGLLNRESAIDMLLSMGQPLSNIELGLDRSDLDQELRWIDDVVKLTQQKYEKTIIDSVAAMKDLVNVGVDAGKAHVLIKQWETRRYSKLALRQRQAPGSKRMRQQEIRKAYGYGVMAKNAALDRLQDWGYTKDDANYLLLIAEHEAKNEQG